MTYAELREMASCVSSYLRRAGLRSGDRVLLMWENSPEYGALYFGALLAGGVAIPLNPSNDEESVRYIATHSGARFAAAADRSLDYLRGWWQGAPVITDRAQAEGTVAVRDVVREDGSFVPQPDAGSGDRLAMVLYTSGTTGKPKGVMLSHRNLLANTRSILGYLPLEPSDRTLAILPFYYSYGNSLLLTHAATGASLVIENRFAFVNKALDTMRDQSVTGFSGVPSHYSILINRSRFLVDDWPHLRYMTCAGGGLPPVHVQAIRERLPYVKLHVMYGQTEGTARLSSLSPDLLESKLGSIGKGIPGVEVRIVEKGGRDVQPGETGELIARGDNVMIGYLEDPAGTSEALRGGWLYTGDLATVDADGFIFIQGRAKEFIKTGGYRVSPQRIEEVLLRHDDVCECAVIGTPDELLGERIVALVVCRNGAADDGAIESIIGFARSRLPAYMVPGTVEPIDAIPKTESGKVRRTELRERYQARQTTI